MNVGIVVMLGGRKYGLFVRWYWSVLFGKSVVS